ncbi:MAG: DUF4338 domain-containing protein [Gammaproteobacteria bacterium]|nr:DUF4338 domain-containing protein [Gammaproteobacteria bacterium]
MKESILFCGKKVSHQDIELICKTITTFSSLSRMELANTICELVDWRRSNGKLKSRECLDFLERLAFQQSLRLPSLQRTKPRGKKTSIPQTIDAKSAHSIQGSLKQFDNITLSLVKDKKDHLLWRKLIGQHHYRGFTVPYGAHLRYFIRLGKPHFQILGCLQFSSPAWRLAARDQWIGWDDTTRQNNLQCIVNNSRFLILPWVNIRYLASYILSIAARTVVKDWQTAYAIRPLLLETMVDTTRFSGTSYRAANWIPVGVTSGRGRMDKKHLRHGEEPKLILLYPLTRHSKVQLGLNRTLFSP